MSLIALHVVTSGLSSHCFVGTQEFRGFGFVSFRSAFAAEDAAEDANGKQILGGRVKVNIAKYKSTLRSGPAHRDERCEAQLCCVPSTVVQRHEGAGTIGMLWCVTTWYHLLFYYVTEQNGNYLFFAHITCMRNSLKTTACSLCDIKVAYMLFLLLLCMVTLTQE